MVIPALGFPSRHKQRFLSLGDRPASLSLSLSLIRPTTVISQTGGNDFSKPRMFTRGWLLVLASSPGNGPSERSFPIRQPSRSVAMFGIIFRILTVLASTAASVWLTVSSNRSTPPIHQSPWPTTAESDPATSTYAPPDVLVSPVRSAHRVMYIRINKVDN